MRDVLVENLKAELEMSERKLLRLQRRKFLEGFEAEDLSLWTMLDLMTLILVFFIVLYADSMPLAPQKLFEKSTASLVGQVQKIVLPSKKIPVFRDDTAFLTMEDNLHQAMAGTNIDDYSIVMTHDRIVVTIGEKISFPVGQAELLDHIKAPLKKMAGFLYQEQEYKIIVSGHTDDTPIHTSRFPSNWELSVARALSVANFLMTQNLDPRRISVEGFGQYRPVADNRDAASRQANRRVEISLIKE
ncbi:MAG: flagellar motor protein MotB [Proteobacteria bacterium]|nr:flagellar motor protein MotB [Pseudomonadota bacterium]